jgi:hypothetical protein
VPRRLSPGSRRLTCSTVLAAAVALLTAACQTGGPVASQLIPAAVAGKGGAAVVNYLKISPAPGARDVNPADGITVTAGSNSLRNSCRSHGMRAVSKSGPCNGLLE